jgi:hypothetical protein
LYIEEVDGGSDSDVEKLAGNIMLPSHYELADAASTLLYQCAEHYSGQRVVRKLLYKRNVPQGSQAANTFDSMDPFAIIVVINSLRLYQNNIKHLIDFSSKDLLGINQKM